MTTPTMALHACSIGNAIPGPPLGGSRPLKVAAPQTADGIVREFVQN